MSSTETFDCVVLGLGGVGSFALRALARDGKGGRYLGVERWHRCHTRGSSHGKSRIFRRAYFEHPSYVPWVEHSIQVFKELEKALGISLLQECGTLIITPGSDAVHHDQPHPAMDLLPPLLRESWKSAQRHNIPVEFLDSSTLKERFPQFHYSGIDNGTPESSESFSERPYSFVGLYEPSGGFVRPELAQEAALHQAEASGSVTIKEYTQVLSFQEVATSAGTVVDLVLQSTEKEGAERVRTRKLLVSAGAWAGDLIPSWKPYLRPTRQLQGWVDVSVSSDPDLFGYQRMPTWIIETPNFHKPLYGVPCDSDDPVAKHWIKCGIHGRDDELMDPTANPGVLSDAEWEEIQDATFHAFDRSRTGGNSLIEAKPCIYTMTPDCNFIIGVPDEYSCIFAIAGLSGHGFKMTPALGQMMADFGVGKDLSRWDTEFCSPKRFTSSDTSISRSTEGFNSLAR